VTSYVFLKRKKSQKVSSSKKRKSHVMFFLKSEKNVKYVFNPCLFQTHGP